MIAKLAGLVDSVAEDRLVVDVGGVGYLVFASARTLRTLPRPGEQVVLFIETHVREDHIHLYGFIDTAERDWFKLLTTVQGVGARVALAILSALAPSVLVQAIGAGDAKAIAGAQGVGAKLAGRIASELKEKVGGLAVGGPAPKGAGDPADGAASDAISALVNLNYRREEAYGAVARARQALGPEAPVEALIRAGLKELVS
ncbi:MAG: Holliday junction branch migration protein RuvA [Alphaproteobacteria bacterium]|nr:Holliday junction branch migration protein RuvA [Alphaproteobacteria bacterium]